MFTKKLVGAFASLLFVASCSELGSTESSISGEQDGAQAGDCTLTQGYWKNHPDAWPVATLKLGTTSYSKDELLAILKTPVRGNGLISLAHQLIAAKLNIAAGDDDASISASISAADDLIGSLVVGVDVVATSETSELASKLDAFNNGDTGPGHCDKGGGGGGGGSGDDGGDDGEHDDDDGHDCDHDDDGDCDGDDEHDCPDEEQPPGPVCGNDVIEVGETCDDGNVIAHDGCSATCQLELPVCGDGVMEGTEECDDGNLVNGDGCTSACVCEPPLH